jgi:chromosome segregation ATPase
VAELTARTDALTREGEDLTARLAASGGELAAARATHESLAQEAARKQREAQEELAAAAREQAELKARLADVTASGEAAARSAATAQAALEQRVAELTARAESLSKEGEDLRTRLTVATDRGAAERRQGEESAQALQARLLALQQAKDETEDRLISVRGQLAELTMQHQSAVQVAAVNEKEMTGLVQQLRDEVTMLESSRERDRRQSQSREDELSASLQDAERAMKDVRTQRDTASDALLEARQRLEELEEARVRAERELAEAREGLASLALADEALRGQLADEQAERAGERQAEQEHRERLERVVAESEAHVARVTAEIAESERENDVLRERVRRLKTDGDHVRANWGSDRWLIRRSDGAVSPTVSLETVLDRADGGELDPSDSLSPDGAVWIPMADLPEMRLRWLVRSPAREA